MAKKKERRDNKTYASDSLNEAFVKVFNTFNGNDAIKVIAENMLSTVSNSSSDKSYSEMTDEELISLKKSLQSEISDIDSEILKRLNTTKEKEPKKTKEKKETNKTESETEQTESKKVDKKDSTDTEQTDKEEEKK